MNHADPNTIRNIDAAALKEFIELGYKKASLRSIAREAGVTTGAFYGYYRSKEVLFESIVGEHADYVKNLFSAQYPDSYEDFGKSRMGKLIVYTFDNIDGMRLLIMGSEGTKYDNFFHELTEIYVEGIRPFCPSLENDFIHSLVSGLLASYCELVIHDAGRCEAGTTCYKLWEFYEAGWKKILGKE